VKEFRILSSDSRSAPGTSLGLGCLPCPYKDDCGGIVSDYDCLAYCCNSPENCKIACPRSHRLGQVVEDCGGWNRRIATLKQDNASPLPLYIPCIQNGSQRDALLNLPIVAIPTFAVTRRTARQRFGSGAEFRKHFGIGPATRILLVSVKDDPQLESYWQYSALRGLPEYLATLDIEYVTGPNFSFANNAPRTEHLVNRARSLKCIEEFSKAGISVIPHLNACNQYQWDCWAEFLIEHPEITIVSKEFQTGAAIPRIAQWHIGQLEQIQEKIGRGLHLVAIAGRRHIQRLLGLSGLTIVDSDPFFKTIFRQSISKRDGHWKISRTEPGECLSTLLEHNINTYHAGIDSKVIECKQYPLRFPAELPMRKEEAIQYHNRIPAQSTTQMDLWVTSSTA
jgi:hypothetical protein